MYLYSDGKFRYVKYRKADGSMRYERRPIGGQEEFSGIRHGQIWEIERHKGKPWQRYEVTCISRVASGGMSTKRAYYTVYMHHLKSRRMIVKTLGALIKRKGCRLVAESRISLPQECQP